MPGGIVTCGATAKLIEDVSNKVLRGQTVPTTPGAWTIDHSTKSQAKRLGRYLNRNKRKIIVSTAALVVAGILTGGIAVGIAVAGKAAGFIGGRVYRRWEKWKNEKLVRHLFPDLVDANTGEFRALDFAIDAQTGASNETAAGAIRAIKSLIQHRDFSSMTNVFAELMDAGQAFQIKFDGARGGVRNCAQAIEVIEAMYLLKYHYERLVPVINFLDNYLLFIFLRSEAMVAEFGELAPRVIARVKQEHPTDPMAFLNVIANSSAVLHTHSIFSGDKDQKAWVLAALSPWGAGLQGTSGRMGTEETLGQTVQHAISSAIPMSAVSSGSGLAASTATREAIVASGTQVVSASLATSASTGGGEVAVGILSEIANAKWNSEQYKRGKTIGLTGSREITVSERVDLMKTMLKGSLDRLTTKFEHWMVSHKQFKDAVAGSKPLNEVCTAMLRSRKHWAQSVGSEAYKMLAEFQETVVGTANLEHNKIFRSASKAALMEAFMHRGATGQYAEASSTTSTEGLTGDMTRADMMQGVIDDFIKAHTNGPCDRTYCYMPIKLLANHGITVTTFRPSDEDHPIFPIGTTKFIDLDD